MQERLQHCEVQFNDLEVRSFQSQSYDFVAAPDHESRRNLWDETLLPQRELSMLPGK